MHTWPNNLLTRVPRPHSEERVVFQQMVLRVDVQMPKTEVGSLHQINK